MKTIISISICIVCILCLQNLKAQAIKDTSFITNASRGLQNKLNLSDSSTKLLNKEWLVRKKLVDSLNRNKFLKPEERATELKKIIDKYNNNLKVFLSKKELDDYNQLQANVRDSFQVKGKAKHLNIKDLY